MTNENEIKPKKPIWKKWWFWLIIIIFVIIIIASAGGGEKKETTPSQTEKLTTYSINQDVRVEDVRWKLIGVKNRGSILKASESRYPTIAESKTTTGKFVEITMEVENLDTEMKSVSNLKIIDDKNREFIASSDVSEWIPEGKEMFLLSNLNPNMSQQFTDIYELPADATGLKVKVSDLSLWGNKEALINLGI